MDYASGSNAYVSYYAGIGHGRIDRGNRVPLGSYSHASKGVACDLDGDDHLDVVIHKWNSGSTQLSWIRNIDGSGTNWGSMYVLVYWLLCVVLFVFSWFPLFPFSLSFLSSISPSPPDPFPYLTTPFLPPSTIPQRTDIHRCWRVYL